MSEDTHKTAAREGAPHGHGGLEADAFGPSPLGHSAFDAPAETRQAPVFQLAVGNPTPVHQRLARASSKGEGDFGPSGEPILWLLEASWRSGDKAQFWRTVQDNWQAVLDDPGAVRWLREMNASGAFASEGIPAPLQQLASQPQDKTAAPKTKPKDTVLPAQVIAATMTGPPRREHWSFIRHEGQTNYYFTHRGTEVFFVAETSINAGGSAYHFLTPGRPDEWRPFNMQERDFAAEFRQAVMDNMDLLDFAELVCEEGAYAIFFETAGLLEIGAGMGLLRAGRKAAMQEGLERLTKEGAEEAAEGAAKLAARRYRARMLAKVGGDGGRALKFSDDELADFVAHSEGLGFGEADIEAVLSVKVRKDWVELDGLKKVADSLAEKAGNHQIEFKKGWDFMKAYRVAQERMLEGGRLDPAEYLEAAYIERHLKQFEGKGSYLVTGDVYDKRIADQPQIGRPDGLFVSTPSYIDKALKKAEGSIQVLEKELGIPTGAWEGQNGIYRIDILDPETNRLRIPNGSESGANEFWHPGGFTSGGTMEALVDQIPNLSSKVKGYKVIESL